jgi:aspartyl-tRNA(Asn)/glutamyl-tRNA(Gln) amidotransferase subunit B
MFCGCALSFGDEPNSHTCPVCLGHPGTLPTMNEEAIHYALKIAAALECDVPDRSEFARKNYFYPDLPKGYQISQYDLPLAAHGRLSSVSIGRTSEGHGQADCVGESAGSMVRASLVDFNAVARGQIVERTSARRPGPSGPVAPHHGRQLLGGLTNMERAAPADGNI